MLVPESDFGTFRFKNLYVSSTQEILSCKGGNGPRRPSGIYRGLTAKELGIQLTEGDGPHPLSCLDHAMYLGRELQKAEACLLSGETYMQD